MSVSKIELDKISVERIELLLPKLREEGLKILTEISNKVNTPSSFCRFSFTLRTLAEQLKIYNQGRTTPGKVVTNARPGQSFHNYGLAIDIVFIINNKEPSWNTSKDWNGNGKPDWMEVVEIFKKYGWAWGGDWKSKDMPHFEKTFGYSWRKLNLLVARGKTSNGYVII